MSHLFQKIQKKAFLFLLGILTTSITTAYSNESDWETEDCFAPNICHEKSECCNPLNKCGIIIPDEFGVTLLYLKPTVDDSHYVLSSFDNTFGGVLFPNGERHQNTPSFTPGFRLEGLYDICRDTSCLDLRFTYLNAHAQASVSGDFLYDTNGFPGFEAQDGPVYSGTAESKNAYNFCSGDITYNRTFSCFLIEKFTFIVGLHGAYIKYREHTTSVGTFVSNNVTLPLLNDLKRSSQFFGVGPQIGLDYQYILPRFLCLSGAWGINARARGALLCGYTKSDLLYVTLRTGSDGVAVRNGSLCRVIPSANAELGLSYTLNCSCVNAIIELGYDFMCYSKCVNKITGLDAAFPGDTIDVFNNLSLQGPYLSVNLFF
jgi:hypothetical protein